jgi:hypothetical protein
MKKSFILGVLGVVVLIGGAGCSTPPPSVPSISKTITSTSTKRYQISNPQECETARFTCNQGEEYFIDTEGCGCQLSSDVTPVIIADPKVTSPTENSKITSPVTITGEAPGVWFFEGQFPVVVTDKNEKELGRGVAKALGDAQTEKPVKFSGTVTFTNPDKVDSGFIIFKKDNPSGDPKNDRRYRISVLFGAGEKVCTEEYKPVCGQVEVQCIKAPCPPLKQTFSNRCLAENSKAQNITEGACKEDQVVNTAKDLIKVTNPTSQQKITSPVTLKGQVLAPWLSEGSAPVEVIDQKGSVLGKGIIKGPADWMTRNSWIDFETKIDFKSGTAKEGFVVFKKDNSSGDPSRDQSIKIPVKF